MTADRPYVAYGTEIANISLLRRRTANDRLLMSWTICGRPGKEREPDGARNEQAAPDPGPRVLIGPAVVLGAGFVLYYT